MTDTRLDSCEQILFEQIYALYGRASVTDSANDDKPLASQLPVNERLLSLNARSDNGDPSFIQLIPRILTWTDDGAFLDFISTLDRRSCELQLDRVLDEILRVDPAISAAIRSSLEELPAWGVVRFAAAPATRWRLAHWQSDPVRHVAALCQFLKAELRLAGKTIPGRGLWTALGDYFVTDTLGDFCDPRTPTLPVEANIRAPRVSGIIPVDAIGPNRLDIGTANVGLEPHTAGTFADVFKELSIAAAMIRRVAGGAIRLIERCTRVIVIARATIGGLGSSSHFMLPGQVLIRTPNQWVRSPAAEAEVASVLVHEAIHQMLYVLEFGERFVNTKAIPPQAGIASPWTGRRLAIHSYVHACFVWYGLVRFWRIALGCTDIPHDQPEMQLAKALKGFSTGNPADKLMPYRGAIGTDALETVASLWDELRASGELGRDLKPTRDSLVSALTTITPEPTAV